jgi:hypothetical protein
LFSAFRVVVVDERGTSDRTTSSSQRDMVLRWIVTPSRANRSSWRCSGRPSQSLALATWASNEGIAITPRTKPPRPPLKPDALLDADPLDPALADRIGDFQPLLADHLV